MEKAPTRPFSWLKALTSAFTFRTLLRHYTKLALNRKYRVTQNIVGQVALRIYANHNQLAHHL